MFKSENLFRSIEMAEVATMDFALVLSLVGVLLATVGAGVSILKIFKTRKAERALHEILRTNDLERLRNLATQLSAGDPQSLEEARRLIKERVDSLKPPERRQILEGLNQPSTRGQDEYVVKIVTDTTTPSQSTLRPM